MKKALVIILLCIWFLLVACGTLYVAKIADSELLNLLDRAGIMLGFFLSCLSIVLGPYAWIKRKDIKLWAFRKKFENVGEEFDLTIDQVEAMVIPVSPRREQPEWILRSLKPRHVSFLYTDQSRSIAQELADEFSNESSNIEFYPNSKDIELGKHKVDSPDRPEVIKSITKLFLERFLEKGIDRSRIFVDTTAGKVPMSIGAFQAAEELNISSIYIVGKGKNGWIDKPKNPESGDPKFMSDHTM